MMRTYTLAVLFVGLALLVDVTMIGVLATTGHEIPDVLKQIAVGALTGLIGLLVPSPAPNP